MLPMPDGTHAPHELPAELVGGRLCLDFVNTVHSRGEMPLRDYLADYHCLLGWTRLSGHMAPALVKRLASRARRAPAAAAQSLERALELREALYRILRSIARDSSPAPSDLAALNRWLTEVAAHRVLRYRDGAFETDWETRGAPFEAPLWPIVHSAERLLTAGELDRVRECPGPDGCGWLFYDSSKNRSRRWCSMRTCGNLAKARRHYRRRTGRGSP